MAGKIAALKVPRKQFKRFLVRIAGRILLPLAARIKVVGRENFPKEGRAILISNHVAVVEPVMMAVYAPRQIEFVGSIDVPHEPSTKFAMDFYGMIEIFRGKPERHALNQALSVLKQGAYLGIFPEGGLWNPGTMKPKSGVAFLSHRSASPVVPIAMVGAKGALNDIFALKRPELQMIVGKPIPACAVEDGADIREVYAEYSEMVMDAVFDLLPAHELAALYDIEREAFRLEIEASDADGAVVEIPEEVQIKEKEALALLLHRPGILKIFRVNLHMPVEAVEHLHETPEAAGLLAGITPMIDYLEDEEQGNPYLLTYRFDVDRGKAMLQGLKELKSLLEWAQGRQLTVKISPERRFYSRKAGKEFVQVRQGEFGHWR